MGSFFSQWWPVFAFAGFAIVVLLVYSLAFKPYARSLYGNYGYKINGIPTKLAVACCASIHVLSLFGVDSFSEIGVNLPILNPAQGDTMGGIIMMIALATPGVALATLWCLVKTRRLFLTLANIPLLYVFAALMGYGIVFYVCLMIVGGIGGGMLKGVAAGSYSRPMTNAERIEHTDVWYSDR